MQYLEYIEPKYLIPGPPATKAPTGMARDQPEGKSLS